MSNTYYKTCSSCGRPQTICKGECCNKPNNCGGCQCREYGCRHNACIRSIEPSCPYTAVIPSVTVESVSNLKDLADCFAHVTSINTTFYIDDKHRIMITWAGPVEIDLPSEVETHEQFAAYILANELGLRSQFLYVKSIKQGDNQPIVDSFYYDKNGRPFYAGQFEEVTEE